MSVISIGKLPVQTVNDRAALSRPIQSNQFAQAGDSFNLVNRPQIRFGKSGPQSPLRGPAEALGVLAVAAGCVAYLIQAGTGDPASPSTSIGPSASASPHLQTRTSKETMQGLLISYKGNPITDHKWADILKQSKSWSPQPGEVLYPGTEQYLQASVDRVTGKIDFVLKDGKPPASAQ